VRLPRSTQLDLGDVRAALSSTEALPAGKAAFERLAAMLESEEHLAALERARVVGVLDGWAERTGIEPAIYRSMSKPGLWCCDCDGFSDPDARRCFYGDTRDAVRAAAAKAIEIVEA
jgi:hypothetical protein